MLPIIAINKLTGKVEISPEIVTRGFIAGEDGFMEEVRQDRSADAGTIERRRTRRLWRN